MEKNDQAELLKMNIKTLEYSEYVSGQIKRCFSFSDWHEQTYGTPLSKEEVEFNIEQIRDEVCDLIEMRLFELNDQ